MTKTPPRAVIDLPDFFPLKGREYPAGADFDDGLLAMVRAVASSTDFASIDAHGHWTSANARLADILNAYFGRTYRPLERYYAGKTREHFVAQDVCWLTGATITQEYVDPPEDLPAGTVY